MQTNNYADLWESHEKGRLGKPRKAGHPTPPPVVASPTSSDAAPAPTIRYGPSPETNTKNGPKKCKFTKVNLIPTTRLKAETKWNLTTIARPAPPPLDFFIPAAPRVHSLQIARNVCTKNAYSRAALRFPHAESIRGFDCMPRFLLMRA